MTRDETVARFLECEGKRAEARAAALAGGKDEDNARKIAHEAAKAHWNAWADALLAGRKALEAEGAWAAEKDWFGSLEPKNEETRKWMERAAADFSRCLFLATGADGTKEAAGEDKDKPEPGEPLVKSIAIDNIVIDMRGFVFPGAARFGGAAFSGAARFGGAAFSGAARFGGAAFSGAARFGGAAFSGAARFGGAAFSGAARFGGAAFSGDARFGGAAFSGAAWFDSATFTKSTSFRDVKFGSQKNKTDADFTAIKVERAFDLTGAFFSRAPSFCQADFKQGPDLDSVSFPLPSRWPWRFGDPALLPKYRAIRRMAIQGADYDREQMAFKGELRSRRWTADKFWHPGLWLGVFYDVFADCGRSIVRPAALWLASVAAFAVLYVRMADPHNWSCGTPFVKALFLSGRNALVLFSGSRDARIAQAYRCLYGGNGEPDIPDAVSFLEAFVQVPLSAALIFLVLLAVKNRFKIK